MADLNVPPDVRVLALCPDLTEPAGGIRKIYRHVDLLNANGISALVVHDQPGFTCRWFDHQTPVTSRRQISLQHATDVILVPEILSWEMMAQARGVRKVILNQNVYQTFLAQTPEIGALNVPYRHSDFLATIVVSDDSQRYLNHAFPSHPVFRMHYSVDPTKFYDEPNKLRRIAYMPRKKTEDAAQIISILRFRGLLDGFEVTPIVNQSEAETARILRESMIFMSLSTYEGSGLPPLEAMACGCITVGYHGRGGREFLNEQNAFPVEAEDIIGFAIRLEQIIQQLNTNPQPLLEKARRAAQFVHATYSPQREEQDVIAAWGRILG
jgi:hypothetical protein